MDVVATLVSVLREGGLDAMASVDTDIAVDTDPLVIVEESIARPLASFSWRWAHQVNIGLSNILCVFFRACWGGLVACPAFADV